MKKAFCIVLLCAALLLPLTVAVAAVNSRGNDDIQKVEITDVVPDTPDEPEKKPEIHITEDDPEISDLREEMQTTYQLTVYYVYENGEMATPTYAEILDAGESYNVISPVIKDYTASMDVVSGVMPKRDVEYTVIYVRPVVKLVSIEDYEAPLGLGFTMMNIGISGE